MYSMFQGCKELESLDLSNFDTSNVIDMGYMFNKCNKLKEIKGIDNFNINKVINMDNMFEECSELKNLDLSKFKDSNIINNKDNIRKHELQKENFYKQLQNEIRLITKKIEESFIAINFMSTDHNINFPIACKKSDFFSEIKDKLCSKISDLEGKKIYFTSNGQKIDDSLTIEQNQIKDNDIILINYYLLD